MSKEYWWIDDIMRTAVERAFQDIDTQRVHRNLEPSQVGVALEMGWDLGDYWQEWWTESGEEWT